MKHTGLMACALLMGCTSNIINGESFPKGAQVVLQRVQGADERHIH